MQAGQRQPQPEAVYRVAGQPNLPPKRAYPDVVECLAPSLVVDELQQIPRTRLARQAKQQRVQLVPPLLALQNGSPQGNRRHGRIGACNGFRSGFFHQIPQLRATSQSKQPPARGGIMRLGQRTFQILLYGRLVSAFVFVDGAGLIGEQGVVSQTLPPFIQQAKRIVETEVVPIQGGCFQITVRLPRLDSSYPIPKALRAVESVPVGVDFADPSQRSGVTGPVALQVFFDRGGRFGVPRLESRQRAMEVRHSLDQPLIGRIGLSQPEQDRCGRLEVRPPNFALR